MMINADAYAPAFIVIVQLKLSQLCQAFSENKGSNMMLLVRFCYLCMSNTNKEGLAYVYATI